MTLVAARNTGHLSPVVLTSAFIRSFVHRRPCNRQRAKKLERLSRIALLRNVLKRAGRDAPFARALVPSQAP
jgi:hypothetical protein